MNEKQQQLTFDKGITNVPSDALCSDNALEECLGMVYDDGEHRVIQNPVRKYQNIKDSDTTLTLLYVHKYDNTERFIMSDATYLYWGMSYGGAIGVKNKFMNEDAISDFQYSGTLNITSVGKTLIVTDNNGIHYYLWSGSSYTSLGESFPEPKVEFKLTGRDDYWKEEQIKCPGTLYEDNGVFDVILGQKNAWNDAAIGLYSGLRKKIWQEKKFHGSFCVRAAIELYDGSYYHITNPVFMLNNFSSWGIARITNSSLCLVTMKVYGQELQYKFSNDYTKWSDIIKNVVLFVTKEADIYDTTVDAVCNRGSSLPESSSPVSYFMSSLQVYHDSDMVGQRGSSQGDNYQILKSIPDSDLSNTIKSGLYYKLCEIGIYGDGNWHPTSDHFYTHTLENITTQEQLTEDDYYSFCPMITETVYAYNSRLSLANVSRGFFNGFGNFMPFTTPHQGSANPASTYSFYVTIRKDGSDIVVQKTVSTSQIQGIYFYYPDPRATHVVITKNDLIILNAALTEHPTLNGAFYFAGVSPNMQEPSATTGTVPTVSVSPKEQLPNYVITSEVNNPFVFRASGYTKVGTGKVIGLSTLTQALSQGQFGQYPLIIFSDSGIWAANLDDTGRFVAVHPMSREVCSYANTITQTDGSVFFASKKGLMVIMGSDVKCVSEQLSGKSTASFLTFINSSASRIAYDYRDSLLWIFNGTSTACWVYAIKSGTFARYDFGTGRVISNVVNYYPDYLLQISTEAYSLLSRSDINSDTSTYAATIITRPMKLENALALKSIMQVRHILQFTPYTVGNATQRGTMTLRIFASNNLDTWVELQSLRGMPWKYYRFRFDFSNMKATDRFSGTLLITQERRTDKLR